MTPLIGFAPDADPTTPGVITDCANLIPSEKGMVGGPEPISVGVGALSSACRGAAVTTNTSGTRRSFAGTQTKLYELISGSWSDVSRGGNYTGSSENRWIFAQFGNATLATNDTEPIQASVSGAFADIATAPKARIIVSTRDFVLAFNTNDATFSDSPDRWWCSAFQDHSNWTPSTATQATSGRLIGNGGEITAATRLGEYVAVFKDSSTFLGRYVGSPIVWQFDQIPGDVGCVGPEAVVDIGGACVFVGNDDIWIFDGTRPTSLTSTPNGQTVRQWFLNNSSASFRYRTVLAYDRQNARVWMFFPGTSSTDGTCTQALVYHLKSNRWGRADRSIEAVFNYVTPGLSWDTLNTIASSWDTMPATPWDSQTWQPSGRALSIFNSSHVIQTLNGNSTTSSMTTGDMGDDDQASTCQFVRLRFNQAPTSATGTGYTKASEGDALTTRNTAVFADGKFDLLQNARFHRFTFNMVGSHEVTALAPAMGAAGRR